MRYSNTIRYYPMNSHAKSAHSAIKARLINTGDGEGRRGFLYWHIDNTSMQHAGVGMTPTERDAH